MRELALAFLRLGTTAFGGPAAHIAMMEDEFVRRRGWLTREQFLDLVGAAGLIPGPSSTEVAIYVGYRRAGWRGLLVAGLCFILPAALMVTAIAWAYVRYGRLPAVGGVLYGIKAVIIAIVAQALVVFGTDSDHVGVVWGPRRGRGRRERARRFAGRSCSSAPESSAPRHRACARKARIAALVGPGPLGASSVLAIAPTGLVKLFLVFLKVGAIVFGSGYVLLAFLRADLVDDRRIGSPSRSSSTPSPSGSSRRVRSSRPRRSSDTSSPVSPVQSSRRSASFFLRSCWSR